MITIKQNEELLRMKRHGTCRTNRFLALLLVGIAMVCAPMAEVKAKPAIIGIGDSIGEGVQSADAAWQTQVFGYLNLLSFQMGKDLSLPLIETSPYGFVNVTKGRTRIDPSVISTNAAVSGATINSLLYESAQAKDEDDMETEADLVLYPRRQTQIEYVESNPPEILVCWIGNNDALSAATTFYSMNASQLTDLDDFEKDYKALVDRLEKLVKDHGTKVIFANIPNVTDIGFLLDRKAAEELTGFSVKLPDGSYTSIFCVLLMKYLDNDKLVRFSNFVLDSKEIEKIQERIAGFNAIIDREARRIGMPVVDTNAKFAEVIENPPVFEGYTLSKNFLNGMFSLDGVHPSNIGHALIANEFIKTMNQSFGMDVPELDHSILTTLFLLDPNIDKDNDGQATGRQGVGLIETMAYLFNFTGDSNDTLN